MNDEAELIPASARRELRDVRILGCPGMLAAAACLGMYSWRGGWVDLLAAGLLFALAISTTWIDERRYRPILAAINDRLK